jgi:NAD(P)-dependent dehydrogenase (short-subunit alcohol dehydrogenase family)
MTEQLRFDNRVAVITGAGRGIGRTYARLLAARGASVVVNDLGVADDGSGMDRALAQNVVDEITAAGGAAVASADDMRTTEGAECMVARAIEAFGGVDIVISSAGVLTQAGVADETREHFAAMLEVDPLGPFNVVKAAWPSMVDRGQGRIVLTSSSAIFGAPADIAYGSGKAAILGLGRSLAGDGRDHGVKANIVCPLAYSRMSHGNVRLGKTQIEARRVLAPPERVASLVAALVHESCPVSGELFCAGGGRVTRIYFAETNGFYDPDLSPEEVATHWNEILDDGAAQPVGFAADQIGGFYRSLPGWIEATGAEPVAH